MAASTTRVLEPIDELDEHEFDLTSDTSAPEYDRTIARPADDADWSMDDVDRDALKDALPTDPGDPPGDVESPRNESATLYIGREFSAQAFADWFAVQGLGTKPYNLVGIHHTFIPTGQQFRGVKTVNAIFDFYQREYGWKQGKGPHLWLYAGDNPDYRPGEIVVVVGTHPAHDGIGITGRNGRVLHVEMFGDFDNARMTDAHVRAWRFLLQVVSDRRRQSVRINRGPSVNNPTTWQGAMFHRDAKTDQKSCPGKTTTHDWFDQAMTA